MGDATGTRSLLKTGPSVTAAIDTTALPQTILLSATNAATDTAIASAAAPTSFTTLLFTRLIATTESNGSVTVSKSLATSVVTDPAEYSTLSAQASSSLFAKTHTASSATHSATAASKSTKSTSNLNTLIPAVVVPVVVVLLATFAAFWFFMRRRHRRDLQNQPAFIMAAKTEKLPSTATSISSRRPDSDPPSERHPAAPFVSLSNEKPLPSTRSRDISPRLPRSRSRSPPNFSRGNGMGANTSNVREDRRMGPLPPANRHDQVSPRAKNAANFGNDSSLTANYSSQINRTANPHLAGSYTPHNSFVPGAKKPSGRGPPPGVGTSSQTINRHRSKSLTNAERSYEKYSTNPYSSTENLTGPSTSPQRPPTAPNSGFRGPPPPRSFSPAGQNPPRSFSPSGNRAAPPPPIKAPPRTSGNNFLNQPLYSPIIKDMPKAKRPNVIVPPTPSRGLSFGSHSSPLLPSPQSDPHRDPKLTAENLRIARLANSSRLGFDSPIPDNTDNVSEVSDGFNDAKSDVSSLNALEKFDFERDTAGSRSGSALANIPGGRSGDSMHNDSPVLAVGQDIPWRY